MFVFMSTLSWLYLVFYIRKPSVNTSKSDFGLGKWTIWYPLIFPDTCIMIYRLYDSRVFQWCRPLIVKNPLFPPIHKKMNYKQIPLTVTISDLMFDRVHPKIGVIWLVNFDTPISKMDWCTEIRKTVLTVQLKGRLFTISMSRSDLQFF